MCVYRVHEMPFNPFNMASLVEGNTRHNDIGHLTIRARVYPSASAGLC